MTGHMIRPAQDRDIDALDRALAELSDELGDPHRAGSTELRRGLLGAPPSAWAQVAEGPDGLSGVVLYSPIFSTVRGGAGVYVSDIWVARGSRGQGLGGALLRAAARNAGTLWGAGFMRLSVHDDNADARAFYRDLGFGPVAGETVMVVTGQEFELLRRTE